MNNRQPAKTIDEVVIRLERLTYKEPPLCSRPPGWIDSYVNMEPPHKESDLLILDALAILGQTKIVEARKKVESSYDGFWYA
jgi:hypothetical protein